MLAPTTYIYLTCFRTLAPAPSMARPSRARPASPSPAPPRSASATKGRGRDARRNRRNWERGSRSLSRSPGQGISYTLFNLEPCGINLPHVHPRATELLYLISGDNLQCAFAEENGGRTIVNSLNEGQNLGCKPVTFISALNSEDPGVVTISSRAFTLPSEALQATYALSADKIEIIKKGIPSGPAKGRMECLKRCNLDSGWNSEPEEPKDKNLEDNNTDWGRK
ncbi:unnamed protein product [Sphagnum tenellum]